MKTEKSNIEVGAIITTEEALFLPKKYYHQKGKIIKILSKDLHGKQFVFIQFEDKFIITLKEGEFKVINTPENERDKI